MALKIDLTKQLTEGELQYLVDRDRWDDIRDNARNLGRDIPNLPSARGIRMQVPRKQLRNTDAFDNIAKQLGVKVTKDEDDLDADGNPITPTPPQQDGGGEQRTVNYSKMTVPQLKEEMDSRRKRYETEEDSEGVELMTYTEDALKKDLVTALEMDDADEGDGN